MRSKDHSIRTTESKISNTDGIERNAAISDCGTYRWWLSRRWGSGNLLPLVMLNPSTADAELDDPTIRRCIGFGRREGFDGILVVNLFGLRATNPNALKQADDPNGAENDVVLERLAMDAHDLGLLVVCAWGTHGHLHDRNKTVIELFQRAGARLVCLGMTKQSHPRHPLYVRGDQPLIPFKAPASDRPEHEQVPVTQESGDAVT